MQQFPANWPFTQKFVHPRLMELLEHIDGYALYAKRAVTVPLIKSMLSE